MFRTGFRNITYCSKGREGRCWEGISKHSDHSIISTRLRVLDLLVLQLFVDLGF